MNRTKDPRPPRHPSIPPRETINDPLQDLDIAHAGKEANSQKS